MTRELRVFCLGAILLLGAGAVLPAQTLTTLRTSGPRASSLNIVFLGDGYTAAEAGKFDTDARAKLLYKPVELTLADRYQHLTQGYRAQAVRCLGRGLRLL